MARTAPRALFGIHGATLYNRTTGLPYGELRILKGSSFSMSAELQELMGGSQKSAWAVEEGGISAELTFNVGQMEDFMIELFMGKAPTSVAAEASGNVSTAVNKKGTSMISASNGISGVILTPSDAGDLKFGKYVGIALSANTFDLYLLSSIDTGRGNNASFLTDGMKIASALSVAAGDAIDAATGLTFEQAGTPAFVTGDTFTFEVRPVNSGGSTVTVGSIADQSFPEFGALVYAQKRANQEMTEFDFFRCKAAGMPVPFEMGAFAAFEIKAKVMYDDSLDGIFSMRHVKPA